MNGVEILSSEEVAIAWETFNWSAFGAVVIVMFVIALVAGVAVGLKEQEWWAFWAMFIILFTVGSLIAGLTVGFNTGEPTEYETHYKVTIDDSVSMSEFMDKYEIVDQDGKIFIVRERE